MEDSEDDRFENLDIPTQISLHTVRNLMGSQQQLSLFSEDKLKEFSDTYGVNLESQITRFGIDLTDLQLRMMEAILYGLSKTRYRGNLDPLDKPSLAKEKYPAGILPNIYNNFTQLPKLKVSQSGLLQWAKVNLRSAGDVQQALRALKHLATTQYCFYYTRLVFGEGGEPKREKDGDYVKEEVIAVDTLFTIKEVRSKKTSLLDYYEIIPSSILLDQRENYFMLIPLNWRDEVRKLVGQRKASSYTFRFLIVLRYQFELERRSHKKQYIIKCTPEDMAIKLKMPISVYKGKRERANKILDEVYTVAKKLGYLTEYERTGRLDIFYLNEEKYHQPRSQEKLPAPRDGENNSPEMKTAKALLDLIISERRKLVSTYNPIQGGQVQEQSCNHLIELLKQYTEEDIRNVIIWGINKQYWCNRIGTAAKLKKHFEEALTEMRAEEQKGSGSDKYIQDNKQYSQEISQKIVDSGNLFVKLEVLNKYVEINDGSHQPVCINYAEKGFKDQLSSALRKRGLQELLN